MKLHHRIVVPFALIALIATAATAYAALLVTSRALRARVDAQVLNAAALVSQSDFALNGAILASVKAITGARAHATFPRVSALATCGFRFGSANAPHRANTAIWDETNDR